MKKIYKTLIRLTEKYDWIWFALLTAVIAFLCFRCLGIKTIDSWDEARHGISAYEMMQSGNYIVNTFNYVGYNMENQISPKDITVSWGSLANEENNSQLDFYVPKPRFVSWRSSNQAWTKSMGNMINNQFSNNHLVPANNEIKKLINLIKEDDYIHIKGYLVHIKYTERNLYYSWKSSISRYDNGPGACETILVTDIKWLKEKP